ncbi:hypothetical protein FACS1894156_3900 [Bacteroidia bacterium]|nr:hypothetical protein FACS1894156_3900 [Bacteroidia bacterium]
MDTMILEQSRVARKTYGGVRQIIRPTKKIYLGEDEFDRDLKTAISGEELVNRVSKRIYKMFENDGKLSAKC